MWWYLGFGGGSIEVPLKGLEGGFAIGDDLSDVEVKVGDDAKCDN